MSVFNLGTAHYGTQFDSPTPMLPIPARINTPNDAGIVLLDGFTRAGGKRVARGLRRWPMFGFRVERPTVPIRVSLTLTLDVRSHTRWTEIHELDPALERVQPSAKPRLIGLTGQGALRGATSLIPDPETGRTRQRLHLVLLPEEVGADGLIVLGLEEMENSGWGSSLPNATVGSLIGQIEVDTTDLPTAYVAMGRPKPKPGRPPVPRDPGFFVFNPVERVGTSEVAVRARRGVAGTETVSVLDAAGTEIPVEVLSGTSDGGGVRLVLPHEHGPLRIRPQAEATGPAGAEIVAWVSG